MHTSHSLIRCMAVCLLLCVPFSGFAIPMQPLADSLTVYANQKASVGIVGVKRIRTSGKTARVYTDKTLSSLSLSPAELQDLRRYVSRIIFDTPKGAVDIFSDGYELGELVTMRYNKSVGRAHVPAAVQPLVANADRPYQCPDGLDGRHIALWGSHGWYWNNQVDRWLWQRAKLWTTVEDLFTSSYTMPYLVPMLENAGAVVLQPRERDTQTECLLIDSTMLREEDGATIAEANVPKDGEYAVYVWYTPYKQASNRTNMDIEHKDRTTHYHLNMQIGAGTWVYVGKHAFAQNKPAHIRIQAPKQTITAIRLGGGIDTIAGVPRFVEGASEYLKFAGVPDTILDYTNGENTYTNDYACRGRWVNYLLGGSQLAPKEEGLRIPVDMSMAFHSDAGIRGGDTIIGTLLIYYNKDDDNSKLLPLGDSRLQCRYLGDYVQTQIVEDMRALYAPHWTRRSLKNSGYAEARQPKVPSFLLELLSHQNMGDMRYGLDPKVKFTISRAIYKGILKYLTVSRGVNYVVQPMPVEACSVALREAGNSGKDSVIVRWQPTDDPLEPTAKAEYFIVYSRLTQSGQTGDWDNGTRVSSTRYAMPAKRGVRYDFRVVAGNRGGISMPSETHCAYIAPQPKARVFIVNNFTRIAAPDFIADSLYAGIAVQGVPDGLDISYIGEQYDFRRASEWVSDDNCGWGSSYADQQFELTAGNTHDYPLMHGAVLSELGYSYCSSSAAGIGDTIALRRYDIIDIICGKQRTDSTYTAFPAALQEALCDYTAHGGNTLISGMYIGSEAASLGNCPFTRQVLHCTYRGDHATRAGLIHFNRAPLPMQFVRLRTQPNPDIINCENPQGIMPAYGAQAVASYTDSGMSAAVAYDGDNRSITLPFILESTEDFPALYRNCIHFITQ